MQTTGTTHIAIRLATSADRAALVRLAALDSAPVPLDATLVADLDGQIVAARSLAAATSIADPFRHTSHARELLELRASQLPISTSARPRRYLPGFPTRRRRAVRSGAAVHAAQ
jgi:hypothetical protein